MQNFMECEKSKHGFSIFFSWKIYDDEIYVKYVTVHYFDNIWSKTIHVLPVCYHSESQECTDTTNSTATDVMKVTEPNFFNAVEAYMSICLIYERLQK